MLGNNRNVHRKCLNIVEMHASNAGVQQGCARGKVLGINRIAPRNCLNIVEVCAGSRDVHIDKYWNVVEMRANGTSNRNALLKHYKLLKHNRNTHEQYIQ